MTPRWGLPALPFALLLAVAVALGALLDHALTGPAGQLAGRLLAAGFLFVFLVALLVAARPRRGAGTRGGREGQAPAESPED